MSIEWWNNLKLLRVAAHADTKAADWGESDGNSRDTDFPSVVTFYRGHVQGATLNSPPSWLSASQSAAAPNANLMGRFDLECRACRKRYLTKRFDLRIERILARFEYPESDRGRAKPPNKAEVVLTHMRACPSFWPMLLFELNQCIEGLDVATLRAMDAPTLEALADRWLDWKQHER